jgi:hypothetical protein
MPILQTDRRTRYFRGCVGVGVSNAFLSHHLEQSLWKILNNRILYTYASTVPGTWYSVLYCMGFRGIGWGGLVGPPPR